MIKTKIIAVGGYGDFVLSNIYDELKTIKQLDDVISINTDSQSQAQLPVGIKTLNISNTGHGAGGDPQVAYYYALNESTQINKAIADTDVAILVCGLGKGTGTGATLYLTEILKSTATCTVVILRTPETADGSYRSGISADYKKRITENADAYIEISNDDCIRLAIERGIDSIESAYQLGNESVFDAVRGLTSIINNAGIRNVDLEDFKKTINGKFGIRTGSVHSFSTTCEIFGVSTSDARSCLSVIELPEASGQSLTKTMKLRKQINESISEDCNQITGILTNPDIDDVSVIYVVSGFEKTLSEKRREAGMKGLEIRYNLANPSKIESEDLTALQALAN
jgi:cell division protein FtsZ